ncbi:zinc finger BED domain-containing protein 4-like [Rhizophagus irregularis DAOM 181602=DAOM 197198]|nr:zinc finger BED domain-containing protein 4-like [Rhizophagus irregularis DAOM 181602=DAOM 197198]
MSDITDIRQDHSRPSSSEEVPQSKKVKSSRKKSSWTWEYFEEVDINKQTSDKGEPLKRCKILSADGKKCGAIHVNDGSTGNAINHLSSEHDITKDDKMKNKNQSTITSIVHTRKHKESRQRELRQFLTNWITEDLQPLYVVQSLSFRKLINELDPAFIIPNEKGIKRIISKSYKSTLPILIEKIRVEAKSVSLITDIWTMKNGQGYIGVTCTYIDSNFVLNEITLTVNHIRYPHTAQHIAESLEETLEEWKLREKVFVITTDNATNMKKAISDMNSIKWQACGAHTLQLIIGKGLIPAKSLILRSAKDTAKYLRLVNDVATRWNSSYLAWSHLIYLKEWIKLLSNTLSISTDLDTKKDAKRLKQIMITDEEWDFLADIIEVLSTFADATTELGGKETGDAFDEENQDEIPNDDINKPVNTYGLINEIKSILYTNLIKYYPTITTDALISPILDPRFKSLDFTSSIQKSHTEQQLRTLFEQEKNNQKNTPDASGTSDSSSTSGASSIFKRKSLMERLIKDNVVALDEVGEYLQLNEIPFASDPLIWWSGKQDKFPILRNLAQKYLAVSATSTASERLFSDTGNLLTNKRTRMKPSLFKKSCS